MPTPQWVSAKISSHTVAVAALNASLEEFLQWYKSSATTPNVTKLAMIGMLTEDVHVRRVKVLILRKGEQRLR